MAKMTLEELRKLRDNTKTDIKRREAEGKEIQVIIGMGTCGIAAGGKETMDAFLKAINENKLADTVLIRQVGCMGFCHSEPTAEIVVPGMPLIIYGNVDAGVAKEIVTKHIMGRELVEGKILAKPTANAAASK